MPIEVGQEAPDFTLKDPAERGRHPLVVPGRKNVVLVFFPLAFSGVCTRQLTEIGSTGTATPQGDAQVLGVSVDSRYVAGAFAQELGPDRHVLLADFEPKGAVSRAYGVYRGARLLGARHLRHRQAGIVRGRLAHRTTRARCPTRRSTSRPWRSARRSERLPPGQRLRASWPQAAATSAPRERRTDASRPASARARRKTSRRPRELPR